MVFIAYEVFAAWALCLEWAVRSTLFFAAGWLGVGGPNTVQQLWLSASSCRLLWPASVQPLLLRCSLIRSPLTTLLFCGTTHFSRPALWPPGALALRIAGVFTLFSVAASPAHSRHCHPERSALADQCRDLQLVTDWTHRLLIRNTK